MSGRPNTSDYEPLIHSRDEEGLQAIHRQRRARLFWLVVILMVVFVGVIIGIFFLGHALKDDDDQFMRQYKYAAVASDVEQCSQIGTDFLKAGGNAVDSAIGTLLCMGIADAQSMGVGGGFFMTIYNRTLGTAMVVDAREVAPGAANETLFQGNRNASSTGPLSIAVPGEIRGYWMAHQRYGQLPWADLFAPAIKMAESGFKVPESLSRALQISKESILGEQSLREIFVNPDTEELYKESEMMKRPKLAATLRKIAAGGESVFYTTGSLADDVLLDLQDIGSIISREDLRNYTALLKNPIEVTLDDGLRVFSPPPPSSGVILSFMLNILDGYDLLPSDLQGTDNSVRTLHRIVETFKFAYAKRTDLADEDFVNVVDLVANLTSRKYADYIRSQITDNSTHNTSYYGPTFYDQLTTSTAQLSVVDASGNAVSVTSTINARFGSMRRGTRTGIIFNDEMDDFSSPNITNIFGFRPSPANFIRPGKRPLSSMCPTVIVRPNGDVRLVAGAAGGSRITTATAFVAVHDLWLGENVGQAVRDLRLHHQLLPVYLSYETGFDQTLLNGLASLGHELRSTNLGNSIVQAISRRGDTLYAASDFRKGGKPAGY